jgi:hypothetical protein
MSPFCLIDTARIRDHATAPHDLQEARWHARLSAWLGRWLHPQHG